MIAIDRDELRSKLRGLPNGSAMENLCIEEITMQRKKLVTSSIGILGLAAALLLMMLTHQTAEAGDGCSGITTCGLVLNQAIWGKGANCGAAWADFYNQANLAYAALEAQCNAQHCGTCGSPPTELVVTALCHSAGGMKQIDGVAKVKCRIPSEGPPDRPTLP